MNNTQTGRLDFPKPRVEIAYDKIDGLRFYLDDYQLSKKEVQEHLLAFETLDNPSLESILVTKAYLKKLKSVQGKERLLALIGAKTKPGGNKKKITMNHTCDLLKNALNLSNETIARILQMKTEDGQDYERTIADNVKRNRRRYAEQLKAELPTNDGKANLDLVDDYSLSRVKSMEHQLQLNLEQVINIIKGKLPLINATDPKVAKQLSSALNNLDDNALSYFVKKVSRSIINNLA